MHITIPIMQTALTLRTDVYSHISPSNLEKSLAGKVALVTGSSRGIGKHIAHALAAAGASVAIAGRSEKSVEAACKEVSSHRTKCGGFVGDVLRDDDMKRLVVNVSSQLLLELLRACRTELLSSGRKFFGTNRHSGPQRWHKHIHALPLSRCRCMVANHGAERPRSCIAHSTRASWDEETQLRHNRLLELSSGSSRLTMDNSVQLLQISHHQICRLSTC